jgi:hypothetical protein
MIYNISEMVFPFDDISLHKPIVAQGQNIMKLILKRENETGLPIFIQLPEGCLQVKKTYGDLIFTDVEADVALVEWIEKLESKVKELLFANKQWFETDLEETDIDQFLLPILKWTRATKKYIWKGVKIPTDITIYDADGEQKVSLADVSPEMKIKSILEIKGVRFSPKSFQIDAVMKQILVTMKRPLFDSCLIAPAAPAAVAEISECDLEITTAADPPVVLKSRESILHSLHRDLLKRATETKKVALLAYLEAKQIKNEYMLDFMDTDTESI